MRMRKKGNLEQRLAACADILTVADLADKNMSTAADKKDYLNLEKIFKNSNPVRLEIGCGKGKFICETAQLNSDINFVACEKVSNVIIDACERVKKEKITNVCFLNCAAEVLLKYFKPHSVEQIYLNFSNPLPKEGYKKQRLTHPKFLALYRTLLKEGGTVAQKTDDKSFFLFSLEGFKTEGYKILSVCEDLKSFPVAGDVETEHERLFKMQGKPIYRIVAEV